MIVLTANVNQISTALEVLPDTRITCVNGYAQYSTDNLVDYRNGVAVWTDWPPGQVAGSASTVATVIVQLVALADDATMAIEQLPKSGSIPVTALWATDDGQLYANFNVEVGPSGGGLSDGGGLDQTQSVAAITRIFDVTGTSRPIAVDFTVGSGDSLDMFTTTDVAALADENHASWGEVRATSGISNIEFVTSAPVVGIRVRRTSGSGTSSVRVYAQQRGPGYNPVYDPSYDVPFADITDARRFIKQLGFGERPGEATTLHASGDTAGQAFESWVAGSYEYLAGSSPVLATDFANAGDNIGRRSLAAGWHRKSIMLPTGPDTLRWRFVAAFNKLLAMGPILAATNSGPWERTQNHLVEFIDGTIADYINWLAYARTPAWFLDNISNHGRDPATGFFDVEPNQNFTREKMQLFTLGVWKLNLDGSFQLDSNGNRIPTYEYQDVLNMARIYSSLVIDGTSSSLIANTTYHYRGAINMPTPEITRAAYPGTPPVGTKNVEGDNIYGMIARVCNWLANDNTVLVYFAKHFIHELVTENPTPQYVRRVVAALLNDGTGVRGSFKAMLRAISLDPEARGTAASKNAATYGRALDVHLPVAAAWRNAEQVVLAERGYTFTGNCVNGSTTVIVTVDAGNPLRGNGNLWVVVSGVGIPANAQLQWATSTTLTLNNAYTGVTGPVSITVNRREDVLFFEMLEHTQAVDGGQAVSNGAGRSPQEWGFAPSVFSDYPFDKEGAPGYLARAASLWTATGVLAMWQTMVRMSIYHTDELATYGGVVPRRMGVWDLTYMVGAGGTPTNDQLIDRAVEIQLAGRTLPTLARNKLVELLDQLMVDWAAEYGVTDSQLKRERRASLAIGLINMMPQAMEQI